jgi:glycosyltransferase involved in cell wall biosynthesis
MLIRAATGGTQSAHSVESDQARIVLDSRSISGWRLTGWERYSRSITSIAVKLPQVSIFASEALSLSARLRTDWWTLPRLAERADWIHYLTFPPSFIQDYKKVLLTVHDLTLFRYPSLSSRMGRAYYRPLMQRALQQSKIVTVSATVRNEILELRSDADVYVVSPTTHLAYVEARPLPNLGRPYFLAIGTLEPRKNLERLLQAFERSNLHRDLDFVIVGRKAWGLEPKGVRLFETVSDGVLRSLMEGSIGVVAASVYEGFGLPTAEATSLGVPVYCSDLPIFRETAPEAAGWFDPLEIESIVSTLRDAAGMNTAKHKPPDEHRYSEQRTAQELTALYSSLPAGRR